MITKEQLNGALGILRWSVSTLARESKVGSATIQRFRTGADVKASDATLELIEMALTKAGVEFLADDGVRLKDN